MGAGIRSCVEVFRDGKWELLTEPLFKVPYYEYLPQPANTHSSEPLQCQNYNLFSWLAGVRGQYYPLKDPVGLPRDISPEAKDKMSGPYLYSHSFYTLKELTHVNYTKRAFHWEKERLEDVLGDEFFDMIRILRKYCAKTVRDCSKIRIIICFD
jgi:hypothetical protein